MHQAFGQAHETAVDQHGRRHLFSGFYRNSGCSLGQARSPDKRADCPARGLIAQSRRGEITLSVLEITHQRCQAFFDHWRSLPRRAGSLVPHCDDYLDSAPAAYMPAVFIHEVAEGGLIVRFMGTQLVARWQRDDTGKVFGAHLDQAARERTVSIARSVTGHPCGVLQHGGMATSAGRQATFEALLLPLAVDAHRPARMIVYSAVLDVLGRDEHGQRFSTVGERCWLDVGAGVPSAPPTRVI